MRNSALAGFWIALPLSSIRPPLVAVAFICEFRLLGRVAITTDVRGADVPVATHVVVVSLVPLSLML